MRSSVDSGSKMTTSSSRLRNSGLNVCAHHRHDRLLARLRREQRVDEELRTEVRRHHEDDVAEVDRASLAVGQAAVVEDLQEDVERLGVGLLDLVEQDHGVGPTPDRLGELAALLVPHVARRRPDQPRDRVPLGVLRHVDPDHRALVVEEEVREGLGELGLADTGRAEEQERAGGPVRVGDAGHGSAGRRPTTARTASTWPMSRAPMCCSMCSSFSVSPSSSRPGGDAGPRRDDIGDVVAAHLLLDHRRLAAGRGRAFVAWPRPRAPFPEKGSGRRGSPTRCRGRPHAADARPGCAARRAST